jgi:hypothetical protein
MLFAAGATDAVCASAFVALASMAAPGAAAKPARIERRGSAIVDLFIVAS